MTLLYTPKIEIGKKIPDFNLLGVDNKHWNIQKCMGENGLVVMFICNHCPYVKSIQNKLVSDAINMMDFGVNVVAIMSNDVDDYPEDSFDNMQLISQQKNYPFPYLLDKSQKVAKSFGAVCTPDIFGFNNLGELQYRGRLDSAGRDNSLQSLPRDLVMAMQQLVNEGKITSQQIPSMGCSIKWINTDS